MGWGRQDRVITQASPAALRLALGDVEVRTVDGSHSWLMTNPGALTEILTNVPTDRPLLPEAPAARGPDADTPAS